ncbi:MAG: hypothetical protein A4E72_00547 [Syntrophus sp. PtaU1.Bin208]|nr:MAG: hypothetical protein A4E72_00547 [Syntrophus sp. PtaU1.Bin208]
MLFDGLPELGNVDVSLEGIAARRDQGVISHQVQNPGADDFHMNPRGRKVVIVQDDLRRLEENLDEEMLGGPSLMNRQGVLEPEDLLDHIGQFHEACGAGIGVVGNHHGGKLVVAHGIRSAVRQHIQENILRLQEKSVIAHGPQTLQALCSRKEINLLYDLHAMHFHRDTPAVWQ